MFAEQLTEIFSSEFPIKGGMSEVTFVSVVEEHARLYVVLRLVVWDQQPDGALSIRDVKEQQIYVDAPKDTTFERFVEFMRGYDKVLSEVLAATKDAEYLMPHDLVSFAALRLKTANTAEEFEQALRMKSRLGKYLLVS
jgi:hypothetical protein